MLTDADRADIAELERNGLSSGLDWLALHNIADMTSAQVTRAVTERDVGAWTTMLAVANFDLVVTADFDAALPERIAEVLASLSVRVRLESAETAGLPLCVRPFQQAAGPVLRFLVEDEALRPFFADTAARLWLELDVHDALPAALGIADEIGSMTLLRLLHPVDPDEAFEILAARFARDPFFAELLWHTPRMVSGNDRWLPLFLERAHTDPRIAARLVRLVGTPHAWEEMRGWLEHTDEGEPLFLEVIAAVDEARAVDLLVGLLALPVAERLPAVPRAVTAFVNHREAVLKHDLGLEARARLADIVAAAPPRGGTGWGPVT